MKDYVAYHNTPKMGYAFHEGNPRRLLSNKSLKSVIDHLVWIIVGETESDHRYQLGCVFRAEEQGDADESDFKSFATGPGIVFEPLIPVEGRPWFPELLRVTGNFGLGVTSISDERITSGFRQSATDAGYDLTRFDRG